MANLKIGELQKGHLDGFCFSTLYAKSYWHFWHLYITRSLSIRVVMTTLFCFALASLSRYSSSASHPAGRFFAGAAGCVLGAAGRA